MNVYEYAMQMEKDGERYYRELAAATENRGLRQILTMLADAEVKHGAILAAMKAGAAYAVPDARALADARNIFQQMRDKQETTADAGQIELYRRALGIENQSRDFYQSQAAGEADENQREAFSRIAREEQQHAAIIEGIIGFVTQPMTWLEDAEWYHLEDY